MSKLPLSIPDGYELTEHGVFPKEWDIKAIGEIASVSSGGTPNRKVKDFWDGDIPWVTTTLINGNDISYANEFITKKGLESSSAKMCKAGTILMAMYGQGKTRGKAGALTIDASINQACAAIEVNSSDSEEYILHTLNYMYEDIRELSNSGGQENLSSGIIKGIKLPLPSKSEQTAIANALSDVDALLTELEKLIAKKQAIKTATKQQLLTGKTRLPQLATYTEGTQEGKSQGQPKGTKPSELGEIPEDWDVLPLRSCLENEKIPSGLYKDKNMYGNGTPIIKLGDVFGNDYFKPERAQKVLATKNEISAYKVKVGDLIIALASVKLEGVGKVMLVDNLISDTLFDHNVALMRFTKNFNPTFMSYMLRGNYVRSLIASRATQVGTTFLKTSTILEFKVPLPSYNEQTAIATILSDMDNEIQTLEQRLGKTRQIKQGMMQELLTGRTRLPFNKDKEA